MMKRFRWFALLLFSLGIAARGKADVLHLQNGDQLTGTFQRMMDGTMTFKSDLVGVISINSSKIAGFTSGKSVVVMLKGNHTQRGYLTMKQPGEWELRTGSLITPLKSEQILAIYPVAVYKPANPERARKPWQDWKGIGNLGYNLQESSQHSVSLTAGVAANRTEPRLPGFPPHLRTNYSLGMAFINITSSSGATTSANTLSSDLRQDFFFSRDQNNFLFLEAQLDHIEPQDLQLRQSYGGGIGRDLIQSPRVAISVRSGLTYVRERFTTPDLRHNLEALAGERLTLNVFKRLKFRHEFDIYPSLTTAGNYRFDTVTALSTPISTRLSFQAAFTDHYLSQPPLVGTEKNDLILSTGIGINF